MKAHLHWTGVRMRTLQISTDPDSTTLRSVTLPSIWDNDAAQALAEITPTSGGPVRLVSEAARWVDMIDTTPRLPNTPENVPPVGRSLSCLLLMRHMAPNLALWRRQPDAQPGFVVRLSAFVQEGIFSPEQFVACLKLACESLRRLHAAQHHERSGELPLFGKPAATPQDTQDNAGLILLTDLDACLAALGLDYDSDTGRQFAQALTGLARTVLFTGTAQPVYPLASTAFPEIERVAISVITSTAADAGYTPLKLGFSAPGPVDALLGVEACGLAPTFSLLDEEGRLRPSTLNRLTHRNLTPESALALALTGTHPLPQPGPQAHTQMQQQLADLADYLPPRPEPETEAVITRLERGVRRLLPMRQGGFTQQASIGGHRLFMRTSEFEDGSLGALTLTPPRETPMARGLMECFGQAVSIGLQFGAPLEAFVKQFAYTHFGPCGTVEGDPDTVYATSMLDYAFRALSEAYLNRHMPDAPTEPTGEDTNTPMLPFEPEDHLPPKNNKEKHRLRLVG